MERAQATGQRERIARAVGRIAAERGLEAVSLRSAASEAGVSMGRVQYYFAGKDALLAAGLEHAHGRMEARIHTRLEETAGDDEAMLRAILSELLGAHPETRETVRISSAFAARARVDARLRAVLTDGDAEIVALAESVVARAAEDGRAPADVDPAREACVVWTLACGLGAEVALYDASPEDAQRILDYHLARVLGGPERPPAHPRQFSPA